jgi:hypothetical protein
MQGLICNLYNAEGAFCKNLGFDQITKYFRLEKHMNQACELRHRQSLGLLTGAQPTSRFWGAGLAVMRRTGRREPGDPY